MNPCARHILTDSAKCVLPLSVHNVVTSSTQNINYNLNTWIEMFAS